MRLELFYPVKPFHINQNFGDNIPCVRNFGLPNQSIIDGTSNTTCPVGYDKLYTHFGMAGHNGTDLQAGEQNVYAACAGTVIEQQLVPARGLGLGILTDTPVDLDSFPSPHFMKIRYWHLKSFNVKVGNHVNVGDVIGISDNTGYSSGDHLHFEGNPMDKDAGGHPNYLLGNGTDYGVKFIASAIDIAPYFNGKYAQDVLTPQQQQIQTILQADPVIQKSPSLIALILSFLGYTK